MQWNTHKIWVPILACCLAILVIIPMYLTGVQKAIVEPKVKKEEAVPRPRIKAKTGKKSAALPAPSMVEKKFPQLASEPNPPASKKDYLDMGVKGGAIMSGLVSLSNLIDKTMKRFKRKKGRNK